MAFFKHAEADDDDTSNPPGRLQLLDLDVCYIWNLEKYLQTLNRTNLPFI